MRKVELENLIELTGGGTPSKKKPEFWNGDIPWASVKDLKSSVLTETVDKITKEGLENSSSKLVEKGNLIIATRMAVGKAVMTDIDVAINQDLKAVYTSDEINNKYLQYFFASKADYFERTGKGATVKGIKIGDILSLEIPLPSLSEQKAIVAKLDRAQRLIDIDKEMLAKYEELIQSVFLEMFGDPAFNPKNWKTKPIKELLATIKIERENPKKTKKVYDYISISDVDNDLKRLVGHTAIDKTDAPSRARQLLKSKDILVSTVRPNLNAVALYKDGLSNPIASTGFCVLRPDIKIINPHYLFQISKSRYFISELSLIANGASYPAVTDQDILNLEIPLPPLNEQNRFEEVIEKISREYQITQTNQKKSEELFSSLVQGAF